MAELGVAWRVAEGEKVSTTASGKRVWCAGLEKGLAGSDPDVKAKAAARPRRPSEKV